jgi:hypothetical protein
MRTFISLHHIIRLVPRDETLHSRRAGPWIVQKEAESHLKDDCFQATLSIMDRAIVAIVLVAVALTLTPLAYASPPDPTWIAGFWDDADFDDVVIAAMSATAIPPLLQMDQRPVLIVLGIVLETSIPSVPLDRPLPHTSRSPPTPA